MEEQYEHRLMRTLISYGNINRETVHRRCDASMAVNRSKRVIEKWITYPFKGHRELRDNHSDRKEDVTHVANFDCLHVPGELEKKIAKRVVSHSGYNCSA